MSDVQKFSSIVPAKKSTAELVSELEAIAAQTGMQLSDVSMQEQSATADKGGGYRVLALNIGLTGNYASLISFLNAVEQNIRLMDVASIDAAMGGAGSLMRFTIRATVYFLP